MIGSIEDRKIIVERLREIANKIENGAHLQGYSERYHTYQKNDNGLFLETIHTGWITVELTWLLEFPTENMN